MDYTTLIFDTFDTVIHIDAVRLPVHQGNGKTTPTTAHAVHRAYTSLFGEIDFSAFYDAFSRSFEQVSARRYTELREVSSQQRFKLMLEMLGCQAEDATAEALDALTLAHMDLLRQSFEVRAEAIDVLEWARRRFRVAMISNFGYAPALYRALDDFGIREAFEAVTVSVEVGWCKPHPEIFHATLRQLAVRPAEALFVGDQLYVDVYGALNSGMDVVWIETQRQDWMPAERPKPTYTVASIGGIIPLLEKSS